MQKCTSCNKQSATIHIVDLKDGTIAEEKHLCQNCAEILGVANGGKTQPLTLSPEFLEDLIGGLKKEAGETIRPDGPGCPACGLSASEFKLRGRLGCPRCYETFRASVVPLLERVHDATSHRGRFPVGSPGAPPRSQELTDLKQQLSAAIEAENYETAAQLRDKMRELQGGAES